MRIPSLHTPSPRKAKARSHRNGIRHRHAHKSPPRRPQNSRNPRHLLPTGRRRPLQTKKLQRRLAPRRIHPHLHPQTPLPIPRPRTNHPRHSTHGHSPHKRPNRLQPRHPHLNNRRNGHHNRLQPTPPRRHSRPHTSQKTRPTTPPNNPKTQKTHANKGGSHRRRTSSHRRHLPHSYYIRVGRKRLQKASTTRRKYDSTYIHSTRH